ncbi:MAG TPA: hypothetical protein VH764_16700 [Gemmatimonadales bacterium]|jgi:hypothetical protein
MSPTTRLTLLLLLTPALLPAQEATVPRPGSRVQVHLTDPTPRVVRGTLLSAESGSYRLLRDGGRDTLAFSTAAVSQLDTTAGRRTRAGKGALLGGGIGMAAGLALGLAATAEGCNGFCEDPSPGEIGAVSLIVGGMGAAIGALIGSATHSDRWVPASGPRTGIGLAPTIGRRGVGLMFTMSTRRARAAAPR